MNNFLEELNKEDLQFFLEVLSVAYKIKSQPQLQRFKHLKNQIYEIWFTLDKRPVQFICSDQNIRVVNYKKFCQRHKLNIDEFQKHLKLEWQAFLLAKFSTKYIIEKKIFKPSQTIIFRYVSKYDKISQQSKTNNNILNF